MSVQSDNNTFDVIVVGSGITGGWAAKELTEAGLKVLVLERGKDVKHIEGYPTAMTHPWELEHGGHLSQEDIKRKPIQSSHCDQTNKHFFVDDTEHPYIQVNPFKWIRGYQVGGRSLTWGRQCYRMSDLDFNANKTDGNGVDWPIRYDDLARWYDYVEDYIGVSGQADGIEHLPDGKFLKPIEFNAVEQHFQESVAKHFDNRRVIVGRVANLTESKPGRGQCMYRNMCSRGCPFGGYFSSNSATLLDAASTNNLTMVTDAIVAEVLYDPARGEASGVKVVDAKTKKVSNYYSKVVFLNASAVASSAILLNSISEKFPNGMGNSSGQVGRNLMDHSLNGGTQGIFKGFQDVYYEGRSPGTIYIPRFQNVSVGTKTDKFIRGYGLQAKGYRENWQDRSYSGFGKDLKKQLAKPGNWRINLIGRGETLPNFNNGIELDFANKDQWGIPLIKITYKYSNNELAMIEDMTKTSEEMLLKSGFENVVSYSKSPDPGSAVHEMGTTRMGKDPKTSVLNKNNQLHDVHNVFVTDGGCMTSSGCQNPSLTYMALTARACDFVKNKYFNV